MDRRHFGVLLGAAIVACGLPDSSAAEKGGQHGNGHGHDRDDSENHGHGRGHEKHKDYYDRDHEHRRYLPQQDYRYLSQYYDGPRNLPPGLQKKYYRTGILPSGWQKRFRPMPPVLLERLPPVPAYYQRGYLDGYAVVVDPRTRVIVDAIDIAGALTGH
jgi:hypothetical protein